MPPASPSSPARGAPKFLCRHCCSTKSTPNLILSLHDPSRLTTSCALQWGVSEREDGLKRFILKHGLKTREEAVAQLQRLHENQLEEDDLIRAVLLVSPKEVEHLRKIRIKITRAHSKDDNMDIGKWVVEKCIYKSRLPGWLDKVWRHVPKATLPSASMARTGGVQVGKSDRNRASARDPSSPAASFLISTQIPTQSKGASTAQAGITARSGRSLPLVTTNPKQLLLSQADESHKTESPEVLSTKEQVYQGKSSPLLPRKRPRPEEPRDTADITQSRTRRERQEMQEQMASQEITLEDQGKTLAQFKSNVIQKQEELGRIQGQITSQCELIEGHGTAFTQIESKIAEKTDELQEVRRQLRLRRQLLEDQLSSFNKGVNDIARKNSELREIQAQVELTRQTLKEQQTSLINTKSDLREDEAKSKTKGRDLEELDRSISIKRQEMAQLDSEIQSQETAKSRNNKELNSQAVRVRELEKLVKEAGAGSLGDAEELRASIIRQQVLGADVWRGLKLQAQVIHQNAQKWWDEVLNVSEGVLKATGQDLTATSAMDYKKEVEMGISKMDSLISGLEKMNLDT